MHIARFHYIVLKLSLDLHHLNYKIIYRDHSERSYIKIHRNRIRYLQCNFQHFSKHHQKKSVRFQFCNQTIFAMICHHILICPLRTLIFSKKNNQYQQL